MKDGCLDKFGYANHNHGITTRGLIINEIVRRIDPKGRTIGEIISEDFNIKGLYLGHSEDANSDPICGKMLNDSDLVVGFDDLPPFCLELKGMSMGQDLVTSFTTPDFVKGNTCKNNILDHNCNHILFYIFNFS